MLERKKRTQRIALLPIENFYSGFYFLIWMCDQSANGVANVGEFAATLIKD